jgi:hypothetical protein
MDEPKLQRQFTSGFRASYRVLSENAQDLSASFSYCQCALSTHIESPAAAVAWNAWHFRHGLVNICAMQP